MSPGYYQSAILQNNFVYSLRITRYYTDTARVYQRHLPPAQHPGGKLSLQQIERKPLMLRTRRKR